MFAQTYSINKKYQFDPVAHARAPYSIDNGAHWLNAGELKEVLLKAVLGLDAKKDACGRFDEVDDVPELNASVKSSNCTLTSVYLGETYEEIKTNYFARVHSNKWIWVIIRDEELVTYTMNRTEFTEFMDKFHSTIDKSRKTLRLKKDSGTMLKWFEDKARA